MSGRPIGEAELHAYVDARLDPARLAEIARYLEANPEEAARVADWAASTSLLREALTGLGQAPVPARLDVHRMAAERAARRWGSRRVAAVAAIGLVLGGAGGWLARGSDRPTGVAAIAREAAVAHGEFAGASMQAGDWADPRYTERLTAPDLSASGYVLRQRQVVATEEGAGSIFVYQDSGGNRISVFVRPMHQAGMTAPMQPVHDAQGWAWAANGLGVGLISSAPMPALLGIADEVRRQFRS